MKTKNTILPIGKVTSPFPVGKVTAPTPLSAKDVTMRKATVAAVTAYVVLQEPKSGEAHSYPVHFLVFARNPRHAVARVACELGRAVPGPYVMPLSEYRSRTRTRMAPEKRRQ